MSTVKGFFIMKLNQQCTSGTKRDGYHLIISDFGKTRPVEEMEGHKGSHEAKVHCA